MTGNSFIDRDVRPNVYRISDGKLELPPERRGLVAKIVAWVRSW